MELGTAQSQLADILHVISQALLVPVILLLIGFIGYALFCIGSIIYEAVKERKDFKLEAPVFLRALMEAKQEDMPGIIKDSGLLNRQKAALLTVYDYRTLPGDALVALIRRLVNAEEAHYKNIVDRNNMAAKISPMIGLMGTLIPLGPGVAALGQGDTTTLSSSLLIAFDTTVAGLIVAAICLAIGKIRSNWYDDYLSALDSSMATMLQKIEMLRDAGEIEMAEPTDYAFLFTEGLKEAAQKPAEEASKETAQAAPVATGEAAAATPAETPAPTSSATPAAGPTTVTATASPSMTAASSTTAVPAPRHAAPAAAPTQETGSTLPHAAAPDMTARISSIPASTQAVSESKEARDE